MSSVTAENKHTFVTIKIGDEFFGLNVRMVKEVINLSEPTRIPGSVPFMRGIINLRGRAIPLVDMRIKFGLQEKVYDRNTVVAIVRFKKILIGLIVDSVLDVVEIETKDIQDVPHFSSNASSDCVAGIYHKEDKTLVIMKVENIFTETELDNIKH